MSFFQHPLSVKAAMISLAYTLLAVILVITTKQEVLGINAFIKPLKFGLSSTILFLTFAWYGKFLASRLQRSFQLFIWVNIIVMTFELGWILIQAFRGNLSHFNTSNSFEGIMFGIMGIAITISTVWTLMLAKWTFESGFRLEPGLIWPLRFGILYFVVFGFVGFIMASNLSHTVGAADGGPGIILLNWSLKHGDLRIPHFFGLHAFQLLPLLAHFFKVKLTGGIIISLIYGLICFGFLLLALNSISPFSI